MANPDPISPNPALAELSGIKYDIAGEVARGAFGVILSARDQIIGRPVAIKTPISGATTPPGDLRRFVQEARVLARLSHPNIVPVHDLALDEEGRVFYTMKFVQGTTLKDALAALASGDGHALARHPLRNLLTVFLKICDATGFAHSHGVLHRDLKPANIMLGDYGEVLVMDWGLAKVRDEAELSNEQGTDAAPEAPTDADRTLAGSIVGTPAYMAPEQAQGLVDQLDERTDIFALGAILYNLLTLHAPVGGSTVEEVLANAQAGRIVPPSVFNDPRKARAARGADGPPVRLRHCPGEHIPSALAAVAMKAMAAQPVERYQTVGELRADITAYLNGFATAAENAGTWKLVMLAARRHKVLFALAATVFVFLHVVAAGFIWKIIQQERRTTASLAEAKAALVELQSTVPLLRKEAESLVRAGRLAEALPKLAQARTLAPGDAALLNLQGNVLQSLLRLDEAKAAYAESLKRDPANAMAKENLKLTDELLRAKGTNAALPEAALRTFTAALQKQGRAAEAGQHLTKLSANNTEQLATWRAKLEAAGLTAKQLATFKMDAEGKLDLDLNNAQLETLPPVAGLPFKRLILSGNLLTDLSPLAGMPLTELNVNFNPVADFKPLRGMPLTKLFVGATKITDLSPLRGLPLEELNIGTTGVADLRPLQGMRLQSLHMDRTKVTDLSPLQGMPLTLLQMYETAISDLGPLKGMKLESLHMHATKVTDLGPLAGMPLRELTLWSNSVTSLAPLQGAPLIVLKMENAPVTNLAPLQGAPLRELSAMRTAITNLSGLEGVPIEVLDLRFTKVSDLAPLLRMMSLRSLQLEDTDVTDLAPLRGIPLTRLFLGHPRSRIADLSPLRGMPLDELSARSPLITNVSALQGMRLTRLNLTHSRVSDLSPLRGMPLDSLNLENNPVSDLRPLQGMRIKSLTLHGTRVTDLSLLRGMPLTSVNLRGARVTDLRPLQGLRLTTLNAANTPVTDITPLKGMPLKELQLANTKVTDLALLAELRDLERLTIPKDALNTELLRGLKKLTRLSFMEMVYPKKWTDMITPEQFWAEYDAAVKGALKK